MTTGNSATRGNQSAEATNASLEFNNLLASNDLNEVPDKRSVRESLERYISCPCFKSTNSYWVENDPFRRPIPLMPNGLHNLLDSPRVLTKGEFLSSRALLGQRILTNIYEKDLLFLPSKDLDWQSYQEFYSTTRRIDGEIIQPSLEKLLFGFLSDEIEVGGGWDLTAFRDYCGQVISDTVNAESTLSNIVAGSQVPEAAAKFFVIQCACDFLSEASAMARNCLGSYGPYISELFKILIDEYGYGVHRTKHSQAFAALMESIGMDSSIHYYWKFYTASSLSLVNYYHYICKNHGNFFKYLGALYYTESTLAFITKNQAKMLKTVFGKSVDTFYFTEHNHIDMYHSKMVFDNLIAPIVKQYGDSLILQILTGFEECRRIQEMADEDLFQQIKYNTDLPFWKISGTDKLRNGSYSLGDGQNTEKSRDDDIAIYCNDEDKLLSVLDGNIEFISNPLCPLELSTGEAIIIPKYIHHGYCSLSERCSITLHNV